MQVGREKYINIRAKRQGRQAKSTEGVERKGPPQEGGGYLVLGKKSQPEEQVRPA